MSIDKDYLDKFIFVTQRAACGAFPQIGKNDKILADKGAVDVMRSELNKIKMDGRIVIGEGEMDEAPMLFIGENLGTKDGQKLDIAVDPLEGTNFVANNLPGALSVIAISGKDNLFNAPETYMQKIASNINQKDVIDLDFSIKKNIFNLAEFKNKKPENLTVCILDRPRHDDIINDLKSLKVNLKLITDGDVSGALLVTDNKFGVDLFIGTGGSPEGVLAAAALDAYNCSFQGRFLFKSEDEKKRAKKMGITDLEKKYELNEIVKGDTIFCATGITKGDMVAGISIEKDEFTSETLITHKSTGLKKIIKIRQKI